MPIAILVIRYDSRAPIIVASRKALFLDRDGVINEDRGYVYRRVDFVFKTGIFDLLRVAKKHALAPVVVTNQSGIARGYFTEFDLLELSRWMCADLASHGYPIARVYYCAHHPEGEVERYRAAHPWRKPSPGMLLAAADDLDLDLGNSILVGDQWTDIAAATAAGVRTTLLVGKPRSTRPPDVMATIEVANVTEAADWLERHLSMHRAETTATSGRAPQAPATRKK